MGVSKKGVGSWGIGKVVPQDAEIGVGRESRSGRGRSAAGRGTGRGTTGWVAEREVGKGRYVRGPEGCGWAPGRESGTRVRRPSAATRPGP